MTTKNYLETLKSDFPLLWEPMVTLNRWDSHGREKKNVACPKIESMYNKRMGSVDLD